MPNQKQIKNQIVIYKPRGGDIEVEVKLEKETIWLTLNQIAYLFGVQKAAISKHIKNIFTSGELNKNSTVSKMETVRMEGKRRIKRTLTYFNLDIIIAVGYRVNSFRATQFRIWATKVLRKYLLKGYVVNKKRLISSQDRFSRLQETIKLLEQKITHPLLVGQQKEILNFLSVYANTLTLLNEYDEEKIKKVKGTKAKFRLSYSKTKKLISQLKSKLIAKNEAGDIFGQEYKGKLDAIIKNIYQTFDRKKLYSTIEDKAANLLYFVIKDHPFVDGNKRIGAMLFVYFLEKSNYLYRKNGERKFNDNALTALCLLIAVSNPREKNKMIEITKNLIAE
ncbi:MAG TPA: Fic/DOC family protein [candidate division WOR-3 bacterium]|uniref:Fic/DOC family protein n=1 Tax=candidate division WOR-3 bacterium TaxID=2052148 RepID=A0A9C9K1A8_UNCW3|nr:Fic/DOC family protein [candidate division WOR-3 bacterium]